MDLSFITAPMVKQSDVAFRALTRRYGATTTFTQMLRPDQLLNDPDYLAFHLRDLTIDQNTSTGRPIIAQLCGNDSDTIVRAAKVLVPYVDGIDLNLGCPQEDACTHHYGGYLLDKKDWQLVENIVSSLSHSISVPVSTKLRLCQNISQTPVFAARLVHAGSSFVTLHARTVSARRRRQGAADLSIVKQLKEVLPVPIVSNGNVREFGDLAINLQATGADGLMVGETLLGNPCLFSGLVPDPVDISLEYLEFCRRFNDTVPLPIIHTHIRHFIDFQCGRRPWFGKFRSNLTLCDTLDDIDKLLSCKVEKWRGRLIRPSVKRDDDPDVDIKARAMIPSFEEDSFSLAAFDL